MKKLYAILIAVCSAVVLAAQPAGWTHVQPLVVYNSTSSMVTNYQTRMVYNTQTPISAGDMLATGDDIRFGKDCGGTVLFNYWIESGINTANTVLWVKLDTLPANDSVTIYMFYGNASATAASSIPGVFIGPHSSTDSVASGGAGGVGNSQRGFRFAPNEDILVSAFGKREPNGTTRYVTLFDFNTQVILSQQQVGGPAAQYSYQNIAQPLWLTSGTQYTLQLFQGPSDGYYFGTSSQIGQHLTYYDMRYCNGCTQNTFPTTVLSNYHYGYPDMWYWTKQTIAVAPTVTLGTVAGGTLTTATSGATSVCPGDSAMVSISASGGTGVYSYQWIPTTGMANPNAATTMVLPPASGMYYCIVTDQCGNSNFDSLYVTINTPPTITATVSTDSVCIGSSFIATGSGAVSYVWTGGVTDGVPFTPTTTSNYTVTGTDANGCTNIAIANVVVNSLPTVGANVSMNAVCPGDSVLFTGSGAQTYAWDNGVTNNVLYIPAATMMYHVTGTDANGCTGTDSVMVTVNAVPAITASTAGSPYCAGSGSSATLTASGGDLYSWTPGPYSGSVVTVSPNVSTTYIVTGTDSVTGCYSRDTVMVDVYAKPDLSASGGMLCVGGCEQLNSVATGGNPAYAYNWSPSTGLSSTTIANPVACGTVTTCYTVVVTDINACADTAVACVLANTPPTVNASGPSNVCVSDGVYTLIGTPAMGTFSGPGVGGNMFNPSLAGNGTHQVIYAYTDSMGCSAADTITIVVSACVGIADNNANDGIDVYPNPFSSNLIIGLSTASHVRLFNNLGQVVFEQELNTGRNEISTSEFPAGMYTLEVVNGNGISTLKVVKQ